MAVDEYLIQETRRLVAEKERHLLREVDSYKTGVVYQVSNIIRKHGIDKT